MIKLNYDMTLWKQFLLEKQEHEFSSTHVLIPETLATKINKWNHQFIDEEDVYDEEGYGREDEPHVTILFGLHTNESEPVSKVLETENPVTLTLGKTSIFESELYDVVKFSVESEDLHRLNKKLRDHCEYTNRFPKYVPHCTLAYVKKGTGKKYVGNTEMDGVQITADRIQFSNKKRKKTDVLLKGDRDAD